MACNTYPQIKKCHERTLMDCMKLLHYLRYFEQKNNHVYNNDVIGPQKHLTRLKRAQGHSQCADIQAVPTDPGATGWSLVLFY